MMGISPQAVPSSDLAGVPDGLERLWTPHRMAYIDSNPQASSADSSPCPFCAAPALSDSDGLIVFRGEGAFVVLNLYPYNPGHLLVCPYRHVGDFTDLTLDEAYEVAKLTRTAMRVTRAVSSPDGFNLGINQGAIAGAGVAAHFHQHIVPRWLGDSNFFPIIARTRALPQILSETLSRLVAAWGDHE